MMKLFLASEAKNPASIEKLREYVGGFEGKAIAYIPTAANGEEPFGDWKENSTTFKLVQELGANVSPVQLEDYKDESAIAKLENIDIIWMAGGACGYLMYWIRRCKLDKHFSRLLERSIYVGSSAGSMVTASDLSFVEHYIGEEEWGAGVIPGLGLVDFNFWPHYEDGQIEDIKKIYKGKKLYLVKNGEEIIVENGKVLVKGEERIITSDVLK